MAIIFMLISLYYVDQPYPQQPWHGVFNIEMRFGPGGGLLGFFNVGIWDRFGVGLSYGASNLIGAGDPEFYDQPGVQIRLLAIEEGLYYPCFLLGFDNQGYGDYDARYDIRSKGLYAQLGKTLGASSVTIVPSIGLNYCLESDEGFDLFGGIKAQFGTSGAILVDYAANLNDPADNNRGYLNVGLRLMFYGEMFFEFALRDLLENSPNDERFNRMIKLGFEQSF